MDLEFPLNPKALLSSLLNKLIRVRLKWGVDYVGILLSFDDFMSIQLKESIEIISGKETLLGEIVIRCNNILWISPEEKEIGKELSSSEGSDIEIEI